MKRLSAAAVFALAALLTFSFAAPTVRAEENIMKPAAAKPAAVIHFSNLSGLDIKEILPPPPAPGSLAAQAELTTVLQAQAWRTPEQVAWAKLVASGGMFAVFAADNLLGPQFTKENYPALVTLFDHFLEDQRNLPIPYKKLYPRLRPYLADARVQPVVEKLETGSYPSGHSMLAYVWAAVLSEIYPERRAQFFERAERASWGRVLGGMHFPSDLEGGRRLAAAIMAEQMKNAAFRAELEQCRAEAAALLLKKAA